MPTLTQIAGIGDVCQVVMWCFVVWSIAQAVFRSFPAAELWASKVMQPGRGRQLQRLMWELRNGAEYDPRAAKGDKLAEPRRLSEDELHERAVRLDQLKRKTLPVRVLSYLLTCVFCQNTWVSLALVCCLASWSSFWSEAVPTALAYAGLTTIGLGMFTATVARPAPPRGRSRCPGGDCGTTHATS